MLLLLFWSSPVWPETIDQRRETPTVNEETQAPVAVPADGNATTPNTSNKPDCAPSALPLAGKTIIVDAGHGGKDTGAVRDGILEKDINLDVALKLRDKLVAQGATVILTREADTTVSLDDRVALIAKYAPDLFLSVHTNATTSTQVDGIEAFYFNDKSLAPAEFVYHSLITGVGEHGNFVHQRMLVVVHHELAPAILVEIGYLSNATDRKNLTGGVYQEKIADAIAQGVLDYFASLAPATNQKTGSEKPQSPSQ